MLGLARTFQASSVCVIGRRAKVLLLLYRHLSLHASEVEKLQNPPRDMQTRRICRPMCGPRFGQRRAFTQDADLIDC